MRVQVKTSTCWRNNRWVITLATRGGNQSWSGLVKRLDADSMRQPLRARGRRPALVHPELGARRAVSGIVLGGPKYAAYEIEPRRATAGASAACRGGGRIRRSTLDSAALAGFPSGQRGCAVNAVALPSQVRILVPPLADFEGRSGGLRLLPSASPRSRAGRRGGAPAGADGYKSRDVQLAGGGQSCVTVSMSRSRLRSPPWCSPLRRRRPWPGSCPSSTTGYYGFAHASPTASPPGANNWSCKPSRSASVPGDPGAWDVRGHGGQLAGAVAAALRQRVLRVRVQLRLLRRQRRRSASTPPAISPPRRSSSRASSTRFWPRPAPPRSTWSVIRRAG